MQLTAIFQITDWQESTEQLFMDKGKLTTARVCQTYVGDVVGKSETMFQMNYLADGNASFVGFEYIACVVDKQSCRLVLKHDGIFDAGVAKSEFIVIDSTHPAIVIGSKGNFKSTVDGKATFKVGY